MSKPIPSAIRSSPRTITAGPTPAHAGNQIAVTTHTGQFPDLAIYLTNEDARRLERRLRRLRKGPKPVKTQAGNEVGVHRTGQAVQLTVPGLHSYYFSPKQARRLAKALKRSAKFAEEAPADA